MIDQRDTGKFGGIYNSNNACNNGLIIYIPTLAFAFHKILKFQGHKVDTFHNL